MADIRVSVNRIRLQVAQLTQPDGLVTQALIRAGGRVRDRAKENVTNAGLVNTGRLRNSITTEVDASGSGRPRVFVGSNLDYAVYQHEGTANNGAGFIYPRRAQVLRFKPGVGGAFIFRPRVRGVRGTPFLTDALDSLRIEDFET